MRTRTIVLSVLLILSLAAGLSGQAKPKQVLSNTDLVKFIKDFKAMGEEFDKLGVEMANDPQNLAGAMTDYMNGLKAHAGSKRILAKYGWNDSFFAKFAAIMQSYTALRMEDEFAKAQPEINTAMAEIDNNKDLSAEQKKEYKAQMSAALDQVRVIQKTLNDNVHPSDRSLVKQNRAKLDKVIDEQK